MNSDPRKCEQNSAKKSPIVIKPIPREIRETASAQQLFRRRGPAYTAIAARLRRGQLVLLGSCMSWHPSYHQDITAKNPHQSFHTWSSPTRQAPKHFGTLRRPVNFNGHGMSWVSGCPQRQEPPNGSER